MNKPRRKQIETVILELQDLQGEIEEIRNDEEEYLENIPENLQTSERYETAEAACDYLNDACSAVDDIMDTLASAME